MNERIIRIIDVLGLTCISAYVLGASFFMSDFSELHIQYSFLNFPVFIGEFLLIFMTLLLFYKLYLSKKWHTWYWGWVVYMGWIVVNTCLNYFYWGPLTMRNAALFYYVWFSFLGYCFYNKKIFTNKAWMIIVFIILTAAVGFKQINDYYWYTYIILITVLVFKNFSFLWRFLIIAVVFSFSHLDILFIGSRAHMIGIIGALIFLIFTYMVNYKVSWRVRLGIVSVCVALFILGVIKLSDHNAVKSLFNWPTIINLYKEEKKYISEHKNEYDSKPRICHVYNPNPYRFFTKKLPPTLTPAQSAFFVSVKNLENLPMKPQDLKIPKALSVPTSSSTTENLSIPTSSSTTKNLSVFLRLSQVPQIKATPSPDKSTPLLLQNYYDIHQFWPSLILSTQTPAVQPNISTERNLGVAYVNILFRLFIWEDMIEDLKHNNSLMGVGFGRPQRSPSIEILEWALSEWKRDGWITPHNSFFHMIYRAGIVGILLVIGFIGVLVYLTKNFIRHNDVCGILLISVLVYWALMALFSVMLELPYYAIFFWSLLGMIFAYASKERINETNSDRSDDGI